MRNQVLRALLIAALLLAWEAAVRVFAIPAYLLPPPSAVLTGLVRGFGSGVYA